MTEVTPAVKLLADAMSERELQDNIIDAAKKLGWLVHTERPAMKKGGQWATPIQGKAGFPDLTLAWHGKVIFIECKSQKGHSTNEQVEWAVNLCPNYYLARPQDWLDGTIEVLLTGGDR